MKIKSEEPEVVNTELETTLSKEPSNIRDTYYKIIASRIKLIEDSTKVIKEALMSIEGFNETDD